MPPVGFEPTILAGEQPQTYTLDCAATVTGTCIIFSSIYLEEYLCLWLNMMCIFNVKTHILMVLNFNVSALHSH